MSMDEVLSLYEDIDEKREQEKKKKNYVRKRRRELLSRFIFLTYLKWISSIFTLLVYFLKFF